MYSRCIVLLNTYELQGGGCAVWMEAKWAGPLHLISKNVMMERVIQMKSLSAYLNHVSNQWVIMSHHTYVHHEDYFTISAHARAILDFGSYQN